MTAIFSGNTYAQEIRVSEVGFKDYRMLLEEAGYKAFSFDLRDFLTGRYDVLVQINEYADGELVENGNTNFYMGSNKVLLTDFPEVQRGDIKLEDMADPEAGIFKQAESLTIGFYPSGVDSTANVLVSISEMGRSMVNRLLLKPIKMPYGSYYNYDVRPFRIDSFEPGKFIPLVFYGSFWYDERIGMMRFCGEKEIAPDLSSEIATNVPHYYVIGVVLTEKQE